MKDNWRRWKFILISLVILTGAPFLYQQDRSAEETDPTRRITTSVSLVSINVVVLDKFGFPVSGLKKEDFTIFDDGTPQDITFFAETSEPMSVVLIIDSSGSTYKKITMIKQGAIEFIRRLHESRPRDRIAVVNFNDDISLMAPFSTSWRQKTALIQDRIDAMGGTALYDALYLTSKDILNQISGRKTVVLFTDGIDNKSLKDFNEAFQWSLATDATFHILTVDNLNQALTDAGRDYYALSRRSFYAYMQGEAASRDGVIDPQWSHDMRRQYSSRDVLELAYRLSYQMLQRLAVTSGGMFFKVGQYDELPGIYRKVAAELPYYYTIGYRPDFEKMKEGEFHQIEVQVSDAELTPRYRRGYYYRPNAK
ncbi:MAG: VWA domain-containing protein [Acidobacteria bacterium]|nr:VWA domain-containing protein [Acidobacteriota bacterium]